MNRRTILLLVNPVAGGKPGSGPPLSDDPADLEPQRLAAALSGRGLAVELRELADDDDSNALAAEAAERGYDVVVAGGDGTVAAVATALVGSEATLGILPTGSFNNVARGLALPQRLEPLLSLIADGQVDVVDVGVVRRDGDDEEPYFFEAAGVGIDAAGFIAGETAERRGIRRGLRAMWRTLRWRGRPMRLQLDDEPPLDARALMLTVSNGPYYGFGFAVADTADLHDGLLDVSVYRRMSRLDLIVHFAAIARGRRSYEPRIRRYRARRVTIEGTRRALPAHADGRSIGTTPVTFEALPGALRVFR